MKYIKIVFFVCVIYTLFSQEMSAQDNKINVSAIVLDDQGNYVSGAVITSDKEHISAVANESGEFSISVSTNSLLTVTALGYKPGVVAVKSGLKIITLKSNSSYLVQVPFNQIDNTDLLGGVSNINVAKILETNYYTSSLDNLSSYIPGYSGSSSWGMNDQLILVDGIPRDQYNVMPSEIEQITVLKGAAAVALYGSRAAKGVVLITTKRGVVQKSEVKVRVNTGIFVPKAYPNYLNSAQYMTLYNEASVNDGKTAPYTATDIANYTSPKNPYRYPSVDFYSSQYLKKFSNRSEVTTEFTGGNERARFYTNIGFYNTNSLLNFGNGTKEGENHFNIRGNLDLKLSNMITGKINTSVTLYDNNAVNNTTVNSSGVTVNTNTFWANAATLRPNQFSPLIPVSYLTGADATSQGYVNSSSYLINGSNLLGGISTQLTNPIADAYTRGYVQSTTRKYQFDASLNFNLASVLKGLSFETQLGIDYNTSYQQTIGDNTYAVYSPTWSSDSTISKLAKQGNDLNNNTRALFNSYQRQTMFFSGTFKYNNTFGGVNNVSAILVAHAYTLAESGVYHAQANANLGLQASYNYMQKYYVDFTGNEVHSTKLAAGHRNALSPTISGGWRISNEDFFPKSNIISDLKITGSAGILNTDLDYTGTSYDNGYYWYDGNYSTSNGAYFSWTEGRQLRTTDVISGANINLGFEKRKEYSVGLEASFFNKAIQLTGSYFYSKLDGIPVQVANLYPSYMSVTSPSTSSFIAYSNYNCDQRDGFDLGVNFKRSIQKVDLNIGMVATYYEALASVRSENYQYAYQDRQGKPLDAIFGLKSIGFFKDAADIAASPKQSFGTVAPGDIKYVDVNKDGVIDSKDQVYLGKSGQYGSPLTLGLNVTAKWNNFSFFMLANCGSGSVGMKNSSYYWASGTSAKYSAVMLGRWTPATAETATYPRLTTTSGSNNFQNSDFWLYKNDRISLAKIQFSYDIPKKLLTKTFISDLGIYILGNDLLLIAKEKQLMETNIGTAPQTRYYSVGIKASF